MLASALTLDGGQLRLIMTQHFSLAGVAGAGDGFVDAGDSGRVLALAAVGHGAEIVETAGGAGIVTLAGSRMYTSMADTDEIIDEALNRFEHVLSSVEGL